MKRDAMYTRDTLNGDDLTVDCEIEDTLEDIAVDVPDDSELAKLQKSLLNGGIADFLSDI